MEIDFNVKKHRFKGKNFLLMNGSSGSASVNLASGFKSQKMGQIIGEPCLGPMSGTWGNPAVYKLPNTGILVYISTIRFNANNKFEVDPSPIKPDIQVEYTRVDHENERDPVIEKVKEEDDSLCKILNIKNFLGNTLLHELVLRKKEHMLEFILNNNAYLNIDLKETDKEGLTYSDLQVN